MKSLIKLKNKAEFDFRYPNGYPPSTDIVFIEDEQVIVMRTSNVTGSDICYKSKVTD